MILRSRVAPFAFLASLAVTSVVVACGEDTIIYKDAPPATTPQAQEDASTPEPVDAGVDAPAEFKPTFPEVQSRGGPVIKNPKVVPIVFSTDPLKADITTFTQKIAASQYWKNVGAEYGVGAITPGETIVLDEAPPTNIKSSEIEAWLVSKLSGAMPAFGAPDPSTLYALFYPSGTTITMEDAGELGQSCQGYGGYHYEVKVGTTRVGYAVHPRCSDIDELTVAASHEYFEWATDPFPSSNPAFSKLDDVHWAWQAAMIGELSDLCTFLDRDNLRPAEIGFEVQRHWSNKLSLAGKYPCAPTKPGAYLQAITFADDKAVVPDYGSTPTKYIDTKAVRVPPGGSKTVDVLVYSDQPTGEQVPMRPLAYEEFYGGTSTTGFTYSLDRAYAKPGEKVKLTVKAPSKVGYDLLVMLTYTSQTSAHYWPILVVNDDGADVGVARPTITPSQLPKKPRRDAVHATGIARPFTMLGMKRVLPAPPAR